MSIEVRIIITLALSAAAGILIAASIPVWSPHWWASVGAFWLTGTALGSKWDRRVSAPDAPEFRETKVTTTDCE